MRLASASLSIAPWGVSARSVTRCRTAAFVDTEAKRKRLIRHLEAVDEPDQGLVRDISERRWKPKPCFVRIQT
ncbi:hypothetical protein [Nocardia thraciensis]